MDWLPEFGLWLLACWLKYVGSRWLTYCGNALLWVPARAPRLRSQRGETPGNLDTATNAARLFRGGRAHSAVAPGGVSSDTGCPARGLSGAGRRRRCHFEPP